MIFRKFQMMFKVWHILLLLYCLVLFAPSMAKAAVPKLNNLYRVDIQPHKDYTRINIRFDLPPQYTLSLLPGHRLRLAVADADGTLFRKFRSYSDANIGGLVLKKRGNGLSVTFGIAAESGWRDITHSGISAITIDVGRRFNAKTTRLYPPDREKIWSGVEKLVRDFDPPIRTDFLFQPTDRLLLKTMLDENGQQGFMAAEAALYKGQLSDAEEMFNQFAAKGGAARALALYRLGETYYLLQRYPQALVAFREAEKQWPAFLNINPGVTFYYGDSIARSGDLAAARAVLSRLIGRLADKRYAPILLVRLADILTRQGHEQEALAVYRNVADNFLDNKANLMASMRLNDRRFFDVTPWNATKVITNYQDIAKRSFDIDLREEAQFKYVLLESIHGAPAEALNHVIEFQKKFPRGVYTTVSRNMREVLAGLVFRGTDWNKDPAGLIRFAEEHHEYLASCMEQPEFLQRVREAYGRAGRPIELIKLFTSLQEYQWSAGQRPYIYETVVENAELLGDMVMAEKYIREFLKKFPGHQNSRMMYERLGAICFTAGKYEDARYNLAWLLNKGEKPQYPESLYYLGRSYWGLKKYAQAAKALELFLDQPSRPERLLPDAYLVAAYAHEAGGGRKAALHLLESGLKLPKNPRLDEFAYKAGSLSLLEGSREQAKSYFELVLNKGNDADWQKLARQALVSLGPAPNN